MDLDVAAATGDGTHGNSWKAVQEFHTYIDRNRAFVHNEGERYRYGSASAPVLSSRRSTKSQQTLCKKQQMQWTKRGAHCCYRLG